MENLIFLTCFTLCSLFVAVLMLITGYIVSYKSPNKIKSSNYECGIKVKHSPKVSFDINFFKYVNIFLMFEVSSFFLYPILATTEETSFLHKNVLVLFILILLFGLLVFTKYKSLGELKK